MNDEVIFQINFTDRTMAQADGVFAEVNRLITSEFPYPEEWTIRSDMTIDGPYGVAVLTIQCNEKGQIYIVKYVPSIGDVLYNPDIQCLSVWAGEQGWRTPEPLPRLVKENLEFWRHFWETLLVDSAYLDSTIGKRDFSPDSNYNLDPNVTGENRNNTDGSE